MRFDEATAVNSTEPPMRSEIHPGWDIAGNANGGYLLAIAGRAMATVADRAHPVSLTAHYLSPGRAGPVTVEASVVKAGRRLSTVTATMHSADKPLMQLLGSFGDLDQLAIAKHRRRENKKGKDNTKTLNPKTRRSLRV